VQQVDDARCRLTNEAGIHVAGQRTVGVGASNSALSASYTTLRCSAASFACVPLELIRCSGRSFHAT
jgi:hypothetical protein